MAVRMKKFKSAYKQGGLANTHRSAILPPAHKVNQPLLEKLDEPVASELKLKEPKMSEPNLQSAAQKVENECSAIRLGFTWLGVKKSLSTSEKVETANLFEADDRSISATKKLLDTRHPTFQKLIGIRTAAYQYWRLNSLPYPEPGVRLCRLEGVQAIVDKLEDYRKEMLNVVGDLDGVLEELKEKAKRDLGRLYNEKEYPRSLKGMFDMSWDFPNVTPPDYLMKLNPALYEQEKAKLKTKFEEAVLLAEQAFMEEFGKMVGHLAEKLAVGPDGAVKIFRDATVNNLTEFFDRFKELNVKSNPQFDALVEKAKGVLKGKDPDKLRISTQVRQEVANNMKVIGGQLEQLMINRPRRNILRKNQSGEE